MSISKNHLIFIARKHILKGHLKKIIGKLVRNKIMYRKGIQSIKLGNIHKKWKTETNNASTKYYLTINV